MSLHISKQLESDLEKIKQNVLALGSLVEQQLSVSLTVFSKGESASADEVLKKEIEVNAMEVNIDEECTIVLARQQPTAVDLRFVMSMMKITPELERIGDEAEKIAKKSRYLFASETFSACHIAIKQMGLYTLEIVKASLDALVRTDARAALEVAGRESITDEQFRCVMQDLIQLMHQEPDSIDKAMEAVWCARALERIADHARNICEYVIYLRTGKTVRHVKLENVEEIVR